MGIKKYYDIEYSSQASVNGTQRVYLSEIEHDEFSIEAENDAEQHVMDNPEAEGDLSGDWEIDNYNTEIDETVEGDSGWKCCICDNEFDNGFGNNPDPVKRDLNNELVYSKSNDPRCCDACNTNHVIPARLKELMP